MKNSISKIMMQLLIGSVGIFLFQLSAFAATGEGDIRGGLDAREMVKLQVSMADLAQKDPKVYREVAKELEVRLREGKITLEDKGGHEKDVKDVKEKVMPDTKEIKAIEGKFLDSRKDELIKQGVSQADITKIKDAINSGKDSKEIMKEMSVKDPGIKDVMEKIAHETAGSMDRMAKEAFVMEKIAHETPGPVDRMAKEASVMEKIAHEATGPVDRIEKEAVVKEFFKGVVEHQLKDSGVADKNIKEVADKNIKEAVHEGLVKDIGNQTPKDVTGQEKEFRDLTNRLQSDSTQARLDREDRIRTQSLIADRINHDDFDTRDKANAELKNEPAGSSIVTRIEKGKTIFHIDDHDGDAHDTALKIKK